MKLAKITLKWHLVTKLTFSFGELRTNCSQLYRYPPVIKPFRSNTGPHWSKAHIAWTKQTDKQWVTQTTNLAFFVTHQKTCRKLPKVSLFKRGLWLETNLPDRESDWDLQPVKEYWLLKFTKESRTKSHMNHEEQTSNLFTFSVAQLKSFLSLKNVLRKGTRKNFCKGSAFTSPRTFFTIQVLCDRWKYCAYQCKHRDIGKHNLFTWNGKTNG